MITNQHSLQTYFLFLIVKTKHQSCQTPKPISFCTEDLQSDTTHSSPLSGKRMYLDLSFHQSLSYIGLNETCGRTDAHH